MSDKYLYDKLMEDYGRRNIVQIEIPASVKDNLNPVFDLRAYQVEAFQRFICHFSNDFDFKQYPTHLLFNMATGSGKTLIMAGLILYLYEQGYRNFLFFVHSTNIIEKTRDNFLNQRSSKYLFAQSIYIGNQQVRVSQVENFEGINDRDINICFTTIQKLHSDLTTPKENAITFEDFRRHKMVLISDEAHHMNVTTKAREATQTDALESWENTVEQIFTQNAENLLLEFTATHDYETPAMVAKYRSKVIFRYDLVQFRNDRFSKEVVIVQSDFAQRERMLQALILNQYKQEVAAKYRINLKPVILFKAQRTIEQSRQVKREFHKLIDELAEKDIASIRRSNIPLVQRAFRFFDENHISDEQLAMRLKREFDETFCLSVNEEQEKAQYQILLNTLEDKDNRKRAIFAVQKLNEGWDVLNLFDIVRCYEARDTGRAKIGATTMSEAQLIGRGARYFPFALPENDDRFRRRFDGDLDHELRVLEELHYHSIKDSRYIDEIRKALRDLMGEGGVTRTLELKESFRKTHFYKYGLIWLNERQPKSYQHIRSFADFGVTRTNWVHSIATGHGSTDVALGPADRGSARTDERSTNVKLKDIERNIVQSAIARNPFFTFASLRRYFPNLESMRDFIDREEYLGGLEIIFRGDLSHLEENRFEKLAAVSALLGQLEKEIRQEITEYEGARHFRRRWVREVFEEQPKTLKFEPNNPRLAREDHIREFVASRDWFVFDKMFGTKEEVDFIEGLDARMGNLSRKYEDIYLIRNERHFAIYDFAKGRRFEPDFVLFLKDRHGEAHKLQMFIEPKAEIFQAYDQWKRDFLDEITEFYGWTRLVVWETLKYRLIGLPFYTHENENQFWRRFEDVLAEPS